MGFIKRVRNSIIKNATCIHENSNGYKLYFWKVMEGTTKRRRFEFKIELPEGGFSEKVTKSFKDCISRDAFTWIQEYGDFSLDDVLQVVKKFPDYAAAAKTKVEIEKIDIAQVYYDLLELAYNDTEGTCNRDGYCNIEAKRFPKLVEELDCGYTPLEIKKQLKELELLRVNKNRAYDYNVLDENGKPYKVISIKIIIDEVEEEVMAA